jgi:hypothetical protein
MSPEQFVAVLGAVTALVIAVSGVFIQVRQTHQLVNSRMTQLVNLTRDSSLAQGKLEGPTASAMGPHEPPPPPAV